MLILNMVQEQDIVLDKVFWYGFVRNYWTNKVSDYYADSAINIRIVNGWIRSRDWHNSVYTWTWVDYPQWITANETTNQLLYVYWWDVYEVDTSEWTAYDVWSITSTDRCRFINYWSYTIFLTWDQRPYRYNWDTKLVFDAALVTGNVIDLNVNWTAMTSVSFNTDNNTTLDDIATQLTTDFPTIIETAARNWTDTIDITPVKWQKLWIQSIAVTWWASQAWWTINKLTQVTTSELDNNVNPSFWWTFSKFTMTNRTDTSNVLNVSRPIWLTTQWYCKDRKWTDAYTISLKWQIEWMVATLSRFWIFTDKSIEYLSPSFLDDTWSYVPTTFADWEQLASPEALVAAWDIVFFLTKSRKIRSIWYRWNITEPQIETLSDIEWASIQKFMQDELSEDQSKAFAHYDRRSELVKFWVVWKSSTVPNICLCWDIVHNTWIQDMDKYFSWICTFWTKQYASTAFWKEVYEDEYWNDDDWQAIEWEYITQNLNPIEPSLVKQWRWATIWWQIGNNCLIRTKLYIDDSLKFDNYIDSEIDNPSSVWGVWDEAIWWKSVWDTSDEDNLVDFAKPISIWRLRSTWKAIRFSFSWWNIWQEFVLDFLSMKYKPRKRKRLKDKRFTSTTS